MEDQSYEEYLARRTFQETDPPEHMMTRVKVAKAFSKPVMAEFEAIHPRPLHRRSSTAPLPKGTFDATKEIARQLPMRMLGRIVGLPDEDLPWLVEKGDALIANTDPDFTTHVLDKMTTDEFRMMPFNSPAGAELFVYAKDLMARKKAAAGDTSGVLPHDPATRPDGTVMPEHEFRNFFCLLVAAGQRHHPLLHRGGPAGAVPPARTSAPRSSPAPSMTRWPTRSSAGPRPAIYFRRTATRDFDMHGKTIKAGRQGAVLVRLGQPR